MGFTVQFILGTVLVLLCSWSIDSGSPSNGDSIEKVENENATLQSIVANLTEESNKPKTDLSTETNKTVDKQNSISKLQKSESYKKATEPTRDEAARSIDIEKYISKEFHNKHNVYTLPTSPDTEKYVDPDFSFHGTGTGTTKQDEEHTKEFNFDSELTTPKSLIFDQKYTDTVKSVNQELEHIDYSHESASAESESKENVNLEKLYDETKNNDTKANLNYVNFKSISSNDTNGKNSIHKDVVVEAGTNLEFESTYNDTKIIDESDDGNNTITKELETSTLSNTIPVKDDLTKAESSTPKNVILTTRKSIVLTKPPSSKNSSHISILSNNIESETVKAINSQSATTTAKPNPVTPSTKRPISSRGSIKFADYSPVQTTTVSNEIKKKAEQLFQENQVVPVQVKAPSTPENSEEASTEETTTEYSTPTESTTLESITEQNSSTAEILTTEETTFTTDTTETTTIGDVTTTVVPSTSISYSIEILKINTSTRVQNFTTTTENMQRIASSTIVTTGSEETTPVTVAAVLENITEVASTSTSQTSISASTNVTVTTENIIRTSKGIVFRETVPTTETIVTTEIPSTTEVPEPTTVVVNTTKKAMVSSGNVTTEPNTVDDGNHTYFVPEFRNLPNNSSPEIDTTTETSSVTSGEYSTTPCEDNSGTIAAITISSIAAVCLVLLAGLLVIMRKRQKRFNYGQRCRPVSLDDYSMDNVSVYNSVRRKAMGRSSKRSYGNPAFEDPASVSHPLNFPALAKFTNNMEDITAEFEEIPQISARTNELPEGCDTKNRYANVIPLPETRVFLKFIEGYPNSDYINANYVTGPKNTKGYYIACQAPIQSTVDDFWRMIWEQQTKVILMLTHLFENGVEKCADYLPPSEVLDCHRSFGDFLVTLKKREVKDKYIISSLQLKNMVSSSWREVTHFWYLGWPEKGVPTEANSLIAFLIEARSYMKSSSIDRKEVTNGNLTNGTTSNELNPVVVHCSPGTGRTGVVIACDIAIREFEQTRLVDVPRIVYKIRRDRASSVQTKEQYAFIYKVINLYATKLTGGALDSI